MRIIEQLVYKIQGDNSEFDKSITQSETKVNKFGSVADKMLAGVTVAAIGMVVKKMGDMVISSATALDRVDKLSQKIGLSRVAFQEWDYILGQSGASVEGLQMGIKTLSNAADEAKKGTALYAESFDKLGVSVTDTNGKMKDQETLFAEVFSALADMENQTERTAIANKLLGRSATELAPTLNTSKEGIEALRQEAHDLGLVYSDELVDAGVILGDNIDRLKKSFDALKTNALAPIIGVMITLSDKMLGQSSASDKLITQADTLVKINGDYKNALKSVEDGYIGVTNASLSLLAVQKEALLFDLEKTYFDSKKELDSLNKTIKTNSDINTRNNSVLDEMAKKYGTTRDGLARLASQEKISTSDRDKYNDTVDAINVSYGKYIDAVNKANSAEVNRKQFIDNMSEAYAKGQIEIDRFIDIDLELYNQIKQGAAEYKKNQKAIEARNKAIELAQKAFTAYDVENEQVLNGIIKMSKGHEDSAYWAELNRLATEKLNEVIIANGAETDKVNKVLDNHAQGMQAISSYSIALGNSYDANSEKASLLTSTIKALIDTGIDPESEAIKNLRAELISLGEQTVEIGETTEEVVNTNMVPAAQLAFNTWRTEQERTADEAERQAERTKQAWVDASFGMLSSITSIWGSINQVQENQNQSEIQRIEEQNAIAIQAAKDRGASEEELTELEKSLQADLNDTKNRFAQEEAKRKKAQGTFQAIVDTASAVIGFLANPGGWAGWALSAGAVGIGAAQIAAINSAPVPSYDVGSIRIPETQTATVHKDEMILTAPQAEQARREGITIAPNKASGNSVNLVIYLDGKEIARNTIDNLNSGSVGTIKARVVK